MAELGEDNALALPCDVTQLADQHGALQGMADAVGTIDAAFQCGPRP